MAAKASQYFFFFSSGCSFCNDPSPFIRPTELVLLELTSTTSILADLALVFPHTWRTSISSLESLGQLCNVAYRIL